MACALVFWVIVHTMNALPKIDRIILFSVISASIVAIVGILQYVFGMDIIPQKGFPASTFFNKNSAAQFIVIVFPLSLWLFVLNKKRKRHFVFAFMYSCLLIFLFYARTRAAWVALLSSCGLAIGFCLLTGLWKEVQTLMSKQKWVVVSASVFVIFVLVQIHPPFSPQIQRAMHDKQFMEKDYGETFASIIDPADRGVSQRLIVWANTLHMIRDHLILGVGLENWHIYYPLYHRAVKIDTWSLSEGVARTHNDLLQMIAETSFIGLFFYVAIFVVVGWRFFKNYSLSARTEVKLRLLFAMMSLVGFTVNSLFSLPLHNPIPPLFLMVVLAIFVALDNQTIQSPTYWHAPLSLSMFYSLLGLAVFYFIFVNILNMKMIFYSVHFWESEYFNKTKQWELSKHKAEEAKGILPWRYRIWFELATANERLGLHDEAIEAYKKTLRIHPNHLDSLSALAKLYIRAGNETAAESLIQHALRIKPDFDKALLYRGLIYESRKQYEKAAEDYREIICLYPDHGIAHFQLGCLYLLEQLFSKARQHLEKVIELNPAFPQAQSYLGMTYAKMNLLKQAKQAYEQAITLEPNSAMAYSNLGLLFSRQNQLERSIFYYKKAIRLNPNLGVAHLNLALDYYKLGEYQATWEHCLIAECLGVPRAKMLLKQLQKGKRQINRG
jgi:tetratricopeptide (TPR) repeat protein